MSRSTLALDLIHPIDPWWDLYLPATFGESGAVFDALEMAETSVPLRERGDLYAVAARAHAVLGRFVEAERLAEQALRFGGEEVESLATHMRGDGPARARRRMGAGRRAGARADAACDLAALELIAGRFDAARAAVAEALDLCPGHAEAGRWRRALDPSADLRRALQRARDVRIRRAPEGLTRDLVELLPSRRSGWLSVERYQRRLLGTPPEASWAPAGTGLGRLQDAGIGVTYFAMDHEYARVSAEHALVGLELDGEELRGCVAEGREPRAGAQAFWEAAGEIDGEARADAAHMLVGLATFDVRLAPLGLRAASWLAAERPDAGILWEGYLAWFEACTGAPGAAERARGVVAARPADPLAWRLAVAGLRACGLPEEAEASCRAGRSEPSLSAIALELLATPEQPPHVMVSGRMAPRWPRGTPHG